MEMLLCRSETFILVRVEQVQILATVTIYVRHLIRHGEEKEVLKEIQYGRDSNIVFITLKTVDSSIFWK